MERYDFDVDRASVGLAMSPMSYTTYGLNRVRLDQTALRTVFNNLTSLGELYGPGASRGGAESTHLWRYYACAKRQDLGFMVGPESGTQFPRVSNIADALTPDTFEQRVQSCKAPGGSLRKLQTWFDEMVGTFFLPPYVDGSMWEDEEEYVETAHAQLDFAGRYPFSPRLHSTLPDTLAEVFTVLRPTLSVVQKQAIRKRAYQCLNDPAQLADVRPLKRREDCVVFAVLLVQQINEDFAANVALPPALRAPVEFGPGPIGLIVSRCERAFVAQASDQVTLERYTILYQALLRQAGPALRQTMEQVAQTFVHNYERKREVRDESAAAAAQMPLATAAQTAAALRGVAPKKRPSATQARPAGKEPRTSSTTPTRPPMPPLPPPTAPLPPLSPPASQFVLDPDHSMPPTMFG